ncbi:MAG: MraY family glycosyltransferase [Candidatus Firestonebacteria bacterium]|nr:MraY family glycosyltransferase [Candidatus Firestonebacteria bacterium]
MSVDFKYWALFSLSALLGIIITKQVMKLAVRYDAVDKPSHRKVHRSLVPLWGGVGIYGAFFSTLLIYYLFSNLFGPALRLNDGLLARKLLGLFVGGTILIGVGLIDDKWGLPPKVKLFGQSVVALVVIYFGVRIMGVTIPVWNKYINFPTAVSVAITLIWIVALINSMNFIDGLDGLAGGIAFIGCAAFFCISFLKPPSSGLYIAGKVSFFISIISIVLAGSTLGFLRFNFNPARVFMGDGGSMFLGLMLASISIIGSYKGLTAITLFTPALILSIPIFDIVFAVYRRWKNHTPLSQADKKHLHHRLLALGLSQKQAILLLYAAAVIFAALAVVLS